MDALQILHLKGNHLTGTIPDLGRMPRLSWLDLSNNVLHGTIPQSFAISRSIEDLRLGGNRIYEPIPHGLCNHPNINGGATKQFGCDGVICPLGSYSDVGHAVESHGCTRCPPGETTLYLGSSKAACQTFEPTKILSIFYDVMQGNVWPPAFQHNWGDFEVDICDWAGISCDSSGELISMGFPLVGLEEY